jgi:hypothetical protein
MKTGKLMKFSRAAGDVQAYLYRDADTFRASLYLLSGGERSREPIHTLADADEDHLLAEVRAWVQEHYPRPR